MAPGLMTLTRSERTNQDAVKMAFDGVFEALHSQLRLADGKYRYVGRDGSEQDACTMGSIFRRIYERAKHAKYH